MEVRPDQKMKSSFFQAAVVSIVLFGCNTWTLNKHTEKKLDGNYTRMLRAILNKSWRQHPIKKQLYGHLRPNTKTIQVRLTRYAGHRWRSRDELLSGVLLWISSHGRANAGPPNRTYRKQLRADTRYRHEDLPESMYDSEWWQDRVMIMIMAIMYVFFNCAHIQIFLYFFYLIFLIFRSHIVFMSILGLLSWSL